jgi:hypothetical protein
MFLQIRGASRNAMLEGPSSLTDAYTPLRFDAPPAPNQNFAKSRHPPAPGTRFKEGPGISPKKKSVSFLVLLVLSSCSFKEPGQQDDQDEENKLLNLEEMKVCFSGLTHNPKP